jgi:hypothetical protein
VKNRTNKDLISIIKGRLADPNSNKPLVLKVSEIGTDGISLIIEACSNFIQDVIFGNSQDPTGQLQQRQHKDEILYENIAGYVEDSSQKVQEKIAALHAKKPIDSNELCRVVSTHKRSLNQQIKLPLDNSQKILAIQTRISSTVNKLVEHCRARIQIIFDDNMIATDDSHITSIDTSLEDIEEAEEAETINAITSPSTPQEESPSLEEIFQELSQEEAAEYITDIFNKILIQPFLIEYADSLKKLGLDREIFIGDLNYKISLLPINELRKLSRKLHNKILETHPNTNFDDLIIDAINGIESIKREVVAIGTSDAMRSAFYESFSKDLIRSTHDRLSTLVASLEKLKGVSLLSLTSSSSPVTLENFEEVAFKEFHALCQALDAAGPNGSTEVKTKIEIYMAERSQSPEAGFNIEQVILILRNTLSKIESKGKKRADAKCDLRLLFPSKMNLTMYARTALKKALNEILEEITSHYVNLIQGFSILYCHLIADVIQKVVEETKSDNTILLDNAKATSIGQYQIMISQLILSKSQEYYAALRGQNGGFISHKSVFEFYLNEHQNLFKMLTAEVADFIDKNRCPELIDREQLKAHLSKRVVLEPELPRKLIKYTFFSIAAGDQKEPTQSSDTFLGFRFKDRTYIEDIFDQSQKDLKDMKRQKELMALSLWGETVGDTPPQIDDSELYRLQAIIAVEEDINPTDEQNLERLLAKLAKDLNNNFRGGYPWWTPETIRPHVVGYLEQIQEEDSQENPTPEHISETDQRIQKFKDWHETLVELKRPRGLRKIINSIHIIFSNPATVKTLPAIQKEKILEIAELFMNNHTVETLSSGKKQDRFNVGEYDLADMLRKATQPEKFRERREIEAIEETLARMSTSVQRLEDELQQCDNSLTEDETVNEELFQLELKEQDLEDEIKILDSKIKELDSLVRQVSGTYSDAIINNDSSTADQKEKELKSLRDEKKTLDSNRESFINKLQEIQLEIEGIKSRKIDTVQIENRKRELEEKIIILLDKQSEFLSALRTINEQFRHQLT